MNDITPVSTELVPLGLRLRLLRCFRIAVALLVLAAWLTLSSTRGAPFVTVGVVTAAFLAATGVLEAIWWRVARPALGIFGWVVVADTVYLGWASYGTGGLRSPLIALIPLQLVTVTLLASFRTGVRLALCQCILLLGAFYAQRADVLTALGGRSGRLDAGYESVVVVLIGWWLLTIVTAMFAAVNEREIRRRRSDVEALAALAERLAAADGAGSVANGLAAAVQDAFGYPSSVVVVARAGRVEVLARRGVGTGSAAVPPSCELSDCPVIADALGAGRPTLVARADERPDALLAGFGQARNLVVVPLQASRDVLGALVTEHGARRGSRIERRVLSMLERFCSHAAIVLANADLLAQLRELAVTDTLTGLANRRALDGILARACEEAEREGRPLSVVMMDIDRFKLLNDEHGHQTGDRILQLTGLALRANLRGLDVAARYGGEEFCLVLPGADAQAAYDSAERLRRVVEALPTEVPITISAGVASAPEHGLTPETLTSASDRALYEAKRAGRNRVTVAGAAERGLERASVE